MNITLMKDKAAAFALGKKYLEASKNTGKIYAEGREEMKDIVMNQFIIDQTWEEHPMRDLFGKR